MLGHKYPYTDLENINLDWVVARVKELGFDVGDLDRQLEEFKDNTEEQLRIINEWIDNYSDSWAKGIIEKYLATMIFVEISDAGYIIYYIPDNWDEITFNTTELDISIPDTDYGQLVLSY